MWQKDFLVSIAMPFLKLKWKIMNHVNCEPKSVIFPSCKFEGRNRICRHTYISRSMLGYASYVGNNCNIVSTKVGRYSCIGPYVRTTSGTHPIDMVSVHPAFYSIRKQIGVTFVTEQRFDENMDRKYHTMIGNDVWIGDSALLMEGISIGNGAVVAAGSVVTKDVPDYAIVAGVPAEIIRYRFSETDIRALLDIKWWDKDVQWLKHHVDEFLHIEQFLENREGE